VKNTKNPSMAASVGAREQFGIAPTASRQWSGLPFAGYTPALTGTQAVTHAAAARKADDRVPEPRGRQR
jgi:hypothetical protein